MYSNNKQIRDVADVAARIMSGQQPVAEELKGGQKKIDKNHNNKIDGQDFAILRGEKKVKEEVEQVDETVGVTDYNPKSQGGTRKELLAQYSKSGDPKHAESARKAGATQSELKSARPNMNKEEVEELDELSKDTLHSYVKKSFSDKEKPNLNTPERQKGLRKATSRLYKEDEEQIDEVKLADLPSRKVQGRAYGASKPEPHWSAGLKGPKDSELKSIESEKKKKKFSEMVNLYNEKGLKSISEMLAKEEASEEEFNKEVDDAKAKNAGKKKNDEIAKGAVQSTKNEEIEIVDYPLDVNEINGVQMDSVDEAVRVLDVSKSNAGVRPKTPEERNRAAAAVKTARANKPTDRYTAKPVTGAGSVGAGQRQAGKPVSHIAVREEAEDLDEREMTDSEMKKREEIVKSMKKGIAGFKDRYGDRAKNVMYATATKQAMKD